MRLHELTKFHTEMSPESPSLYTTLFTIAMNKARYEGLPADLQKSLMTIPERTSLPILVNNGTSPSSRLVNKR